MKKRCLKVLVVDDNVDTADSLSLLLHELGHDVCIAHDGASSFDIAVDYRPDIMLLDIALPGLDGYLLAMQIREREHFQNTVLVALTGYGDASGHQRSIKAGFNHHMTKPADFNKLRAILASVLENVEAETASA